MVNLRHYPGGDVAEAIAVSGQDVYIAGIGFNSSNHEVSFYWNNGVYTQLSADSSFSYCSSIAVSGNDVYVAGNENAENPSREIAKCWKNGVATNLTDGSFNATANCVYLNGGDVYVCGNEGSPIPPFSNDRLRDDTNIHFVQLKEDTIEVLHRKAESRGCIQLRDSLRQGIEFQYQRLCGCRAVQRAIAVPMVLEFQTQCGIKGHQFCHTICLDDDQMDVRGWHMKAKIQK